MQCQQANELLSDYTARALAPALTVSVDNHLAECASCRELAGGLQRAWARLDQMPVVEPPPGLHASLMSALDDHLAQGARNSAQRRKERFQVQWNWRAMFQPRTLGYATALLAVVLGSLEVVHTQRAAIDPLGAVMHALHPSAPVRPPMPSVRAMHTWWTAGRGDNAITVQLQAAPSADTSLSSLSYRAELRQGGKTNDSRSASLIAGTQGHFDATGAATVTLPLSQKQLLRDSTLTLHVTLSMPNVENAPEPQKVIIPLTLSDELKDASGP